MSGPYWDVAWNPMTGCTPISPGCERCWAERTSRRFYSGWNPSAHFTPTFHPDRLDKPLHWHKPRRVFVCNTSDLFHESFTDEQIIAVFTVMTLHPRHTFMVLTKRPQRMQEIIRWLDMESQSADFRTFELPNVHLGVTVCNQAEADRNIPILLNTPAAVRWLSIEPMLGPVTLINGTGSWDYLRGAHSRNISTSRIDWVVLGAETGPGARIMQPEWALDVFQQCKAAGVPFFWKGGSRSVVYDEEMASTKELP